MIPEKPVITMKALVLQDCIPLLARCVVSDTFMHADTKAPVGFRG